jgi:hypothetical protein
MESDIDLFFLHEGQEAMSYLTFIQVAARLIEVTTTMDFPPFSGDGRYLEALDVDRMERVLGSREDDSTNTFTARMLLLLESQPVSEESRYGRLIEEIVGFYYRDYDGHEHDFVPTFLLNDILRSWRTLTLNYEHDRQQVRRCPVGPEQDLAKAKSSLKNFKLKVSRLATCYSMVVHLACADAPVTQEQVVQLCRMTPQERFAALRGRTADADAVLEDLVARYERFLDLVQKPRQELLAIFSDDASRRAHLEEAAGYGDAIYSLLSCLTPPDRMRALVV